MRRSPVPGMPLPKRRRTDAESPESPDQPELEPSPWDEDEGAAKAEDAYLNWLEGPS